METKNNLVVRKVWTDDETFTHTEFLSDEELALLEEFIKELMKKGIEVGIFINEEYDVEAFFSEEELSGKYKEGNDILERCRSNIDTSEFPNMKFDERITVHKISNTKVIL